MNISKRVVVAMSGGVDSSVTAAVLKDQGHDVIGISMQVWDYSRFTSIEGEKFDTCCSLDDIHDARRVADQLQIPFYVVNFEEEFQRLVIDDFMREYFQGRTPNPCVRCNQWIKFELLMAKAMELSADYLATGHYARIDRKQDGRYQLKKGVDDSKDQSYFLFTLNQQQLARTLFPLGGMTKVKVRELAEHFGLRVAAKGESQDVCFVPDGNYVRFLEEAQGEGQLSGEIVNELGEVLGRHTGLYRYTVGQRRGLGIAHTEPLYVVRLDFMRKQVVVGPKSSMYCDGLTAAAVNWINEPDTFPITALCKIRYRHKPISCRITPLSVDRFDVKFISPEKGVTPGQAVVFYQDDTVLGGGWIE